MTSDKTCFPSLLSLRVTHSELLKRHQAQGNEAETLKLIEAFIHKGKATGTLLDSEEDRWAAQGFLDYWSAILYRAGHEPPEATLQDFDPNQVPMPADGQCPYVGLRAYQEGDQPVFYGRQSLIKQMLQTIESERLLLVTGASGSGKTSVVFGGLLPQLKARALPDSQNWLYYSLMAPSGYQPLETLAQLVCPDTADKSQWIARLVKHLEQDPRRLAQFVQQVGKDKPALFVIDQLEQIFTLCQDRTAQRTFIKSLLYLIQTAEPMHRVVLILQSDYESQLAAIPDFDPFFRQVRVSVMPPSVDELRSIITKPADLIGLKFEEGVVDALAQDTLYEPDGLSLLQLILTALWEKRDRNRITWQHYRDMGRGRHALVQRADSLFETLSANEQAIAKQIMLSLVQLGNGMNLVKRRISQKGLTESVGVPQTQKHPEDSGLAQEAEATNVANIVTSEASRKVEHSPETAQLSINALFQAAEQMPTLQKRAQGLLARRLKTEFESSPPLFPWETSLAEYPLEVWNAQPVRISGIQSWLPHLQTAKLSSLLPETVLARLLERCQIMAQTSIQSGVKLVRVVESLFPENSELLEPIANMVLTPAYRSGGNSPALEIDLPHGYEGAEPQQQIALSMLAAKEIFDLLNLTVSPKQPIFERQWKMLLGGDLYLKVVLIEPNGLHIRGQLPCGGLLRLQKDESEMLTQRDSPGLLSMEVSDLQINQSYPLEVKLVAQDEASLRFSVRIVSAENYAGRGV